MAEVITGEHSRYRSNLIDVHASMKILIWDIGPERPVRPAKPVPPNAPPDSVEALIAGIELKEAVANFQQQLEHYVVLLKAHDSWHAQHNGPTVILQWSCDARDTFANDGRAVAEGRQHKRRYYRYDPRAPRMGLPVGVEPGASHQAALERQAADDHAHEEARRNDPVFGEHA
jgi:hypothetical protein